jgi:hypothetical protein
VSSVLTPTRADLTAEREHILARSVFDEHQLRVRAAYHQLSVEEYVILRELDEIDYLLGTDSEDSEQA